VAVLLWWNEEIIVAEVGTQLLFLLILELVLTNPTDRTWCQSISEAFNKLIALCLIRFFAANFVQVRTLILTTGPIVRAILPMLIV